MIVILPPSKNMKQNQRDMPYRTVKRMSEEKIALCPSGGKVIAEGAGET